MKLIGLTGGVGMGKSTAASFLSQAGVRVVDTDEIAHQLVRPGQPALAEIQREFGSQFITPTGELDRAALARKVFADTAARQRLEAILHPRIRQAWSAQVEAWRQEDYPAAAVIIPLLFETGVETAFDRVVCVACSLATQQQRLLARGWNATQLQQRIAAQMPVEQKIIRSHFVIWSEGTLEVHRQQLAEILQKL